MVVDQVQLRSAWTYPSGEYDRPARRVTGVLASRYVAALGYTQFLVGGEPVDPATVEDVTANAGPSAGNCGTGAGGFQPGNTCAQGGGSGHDVHTQHGLVGHLAYHPLNFSMAHLNKISLMNPKGIQNGVFKTPWVTKDQLATLKAVLPAGTKIKQGTFDPATNDLKGAWKPAAPAPAPATPAPAPATPGLPVPHSTIPFVPEKSWETGKPEPGVLNGVPFAPAPPKFWEKTKDVDVREPRPVKPIDRVGIMVEEADGRVWVAQPTNGFGGRNYTLAGGHVEKGLSDQQNALKEFWEETGLQVKITGHLGDFEDSNNGNNGRLYRGVRVGGAPWDAKIEQSIRDAKTGQPAAESAAVLLVTKERAAELLHRTDDLAQLATVHPIKLDAKSNGNMMQKLVDGLKPAAAQYKREQSRKGLEPGDATLHAVQELRGFNGKPEVLDKADFNKLVAKGDHVEMLRGLKDVGISTAAADLAEQFRAGDHYPGFGCFGSGTYADSNKGGGNAALGTYSNYGGGAVVRMAIPKDAKIVKQSELESKLGPPPPNYKSGGHHDEARAWQGLQAALAGYDAIHVDGKSPSQGNYGQGFYVVLNRSIVKVQKEDAKGHVIK